MKVAIYSRVSTTAGQSRSWPQIAKQLGIGVGTAYRAYHEFAAAAGEKQADA